MYVSLITLRKVISSSQEFWKTLLLN